MTKKALVKSSLEILAALGLPRAQQNERSALSLLALLDLRPRRDWSQAENPLMGITPIMDWIRDHYGKVYAPNTRETIRRQTMHQFVDAGLAVYNPDNPARPVNSPAAVYQIEVSALDLLRSFGKRAWQGNLTAYLSIRLTLAARYAQEREQNLVHVKIAMDRALKLSPGEHSLLIRAIIESFAPRFVPGAVLIYAGDTGEKWGYFEPTILNALGVVLLDPIRNWLILAESVTSHGPVDGKRHSELAKLFAGSSVGLVYVTAFPNRSTMSRYLGEIAWETEVWVADAPSHLIHFNGERFLGPYLSATKLQ
jgi:hypothetical protein